MSAVERIARQVQDFLDLHHRPVGVTIEEGQRSTEPPHDPVRFCILEPEDSAGGALAFRFGEVECPGASVALGMVEPAYRDVEPRIHASVEVVRVGPLEGADQVLFIVTPRQAMDLAVLTGGIEAHCTGAHAVCGEVIARVYESGRPHLSLLCLGMRELCGFEDEELVVGLSREDFLALPPALERHASLRETPGRLGATLNGRNPHPRHREARHRVTRTPLAQQNALARSAKLTYQVSRDLHPCQRPNHQPRSLGRRRKLPSSTTPSLTHHRLHWDFLSSRQGVATDYAAPRLAEASPEEKQRAAVGSLGDRSPTS